MGLFSRKDELEEELEFFDTRHKLVIFNEDQRTCEIHAVTTVDEKSVIAAGKHVVDKESCSVYSGEHGLIYAFKAPATILVETARLAQLEKSMVLQQITQYKEPIKENPNLDMKFWALAALLFVAIIAAAF